MTLDEIQNLAVCQVDTIDPDAGVLVADVLAEAVLLMLPVVKAAEEWRERGPGQSHCDEEDCPCTSTVCRLKITVDQMRREMEE